MIVNYPVYLSPVFWVPFCLVYSLFPVFLCVCIALSTLDVVIKDYYFEVYPRFSLLCALWQKEVQIHFCSFQSDPHPILAALCFMINPWELPYRSPHQDGGNQSVRDYYRQHTRGHLHTTQQFEFNELLLEREATSIHSALSFLSLLCAERINTYLYSGPKIVFGH